MVRWAGRIASVVLVLGLAGVILLSFEPERARSALGILGKYGGIVAALIPPAVPAADPPEKAVWLSQNWTPERRSWFHNASQGTATIPVPYEWFKHLERPELSPLDFLISPGPISDPAFLARLGFVPSDKQGGLPVGFAVLAATPIDPATGKGVDERLGLTCAACHTGRLRYSKTMLLIDGGPAMINLGTLESIVGLSICYTDLIPWRTWRFVAAVVNGQGVANGSARAKSEIEIRRALHETCEVDVKAKVAAERAILERRKAVDTVEGFGRLDALNRIGNRVFYENLMIGSGKPSLTQAQIDSNFAPLNAPVSFPPLWDVPHFAWAQYDASILDPAVRNIGEALGVSASVNLTDRSRPYFLSTVDGRVLGEIEQALKGPEPALENRAFSGLTAPNWKDAAENFPGDSNWSLKPELVAEGRDLYKAYCFECHRGPVRDPEFDKRWPADSFWTLPSTEASGDDDAPGWRRFGPEMVYKEAEQPVSHIGTDPEQSKVLIERKVVLPAELGVNAAQDLDAAARKRGLASGCGLPNDPSLSGNYALNLMAVVARTQAELAHSTAQTEAKAPNEVRLNCPNPGVFREVEDAASAQKKRVLVEPRYRARPLDGIWATAPYLHNGSVASLDQLLLPQNERYARFCVGSAVFDPVAVGLKVEPESGMQTGCAYGFSDFDTAVRGNSNRGHSFEAEDGGKLRAGVIGPKFSGAQRAALIEYLKTL